MLTTLLATAASGAFRCAIDLEPRVASSSDRLTTVVAMPEGKVMIYKKGNAKPSHVSRWGQFGHHQTLIVNHDGSGVAIHDPYGGLEVFDGTGRRVAFLDPSKTLTKKELADTPGRWACHPEGTWLKDPKFEFKSGRFEFSIYNGRKIRVDLM